MYLYGLKFNSIFAKKSPTMKQCLLIIGVIVAYLSSFANEMTSYTTRDHSPIAPSPQVASLMNSCVFNGKGQKSAFNDYYKYSK